MQGVTHLATGILIQRGSEKLPCKKVARGGVVIVGGMISHGILDRFARLTYHPPDIVWHDSFSIVFHFTAFILFGGLLIHYWESYKSGMIFASLPDLDWLFVKLLAPLGIDFWKAPRLHELVFAVIDSIPILRASGNLSWHNWARKGALLEIGFLILLLTLVSIPRPKPHCVESDHHGKTGDIDH